MPREDAADLAVGVGVHILARYGEDGGGPAVMAARRYVLEAARALNMIQDPDDAPPTCYLAGFVDACPRASIEWRAEIEELLQARGVEAIWPPGMHAHMTEAELDAHVAYAKDYPANVMADCLIATLRADVVYVRLCDRIGDGTRAEVLAARKVAHPIVAQALPGASFSPFGLEAYTDIRAACDAVQRHAKARTAPPK